MLTLAAENMLEILQVVVFEKIGYIRLFFHYIAPFYHIWSRERAKYDAVSHYRTSEYGRKVQNNKMIGESEKN